MTTAELRPRLSRALNLIQRAERAGSPLTREVLFARLPCDKRRGVEVTAELLDRGLIAIDKSTFPALLRAVRREKAAMPPDILAAG